MIVFSNQILLAFSLYDLLCIILIIRKQIIAFKKGTFAPPAPPTARQEGHLLPPAPRSGVPVCQEQRWVEESGQKMFLSPQAAYPLTILLWPGRGGI